MENENDELAKLSRLNELVNEFEKLDALIITEVKKGNLEIIIQTLEAKKKVKRFLSESKPLKVYDTFKVKLKKIRDNYGYGIDGLVELFSKVAGTSLSQESENGIDYIDALFSEGTADYVDEGFFTRKNEVATLIVSESLPSHFTYHFQNLRQCYALGLFQATIIYCRAVIETGCFEALNRRENLRKDSVVTDVREYSLKELMKSIKKYVYQGNWENADKVIKKADEILHSKRENVIINKNQAYNAIKDTFAIIEELFSGDHRRRKRR
jgi:ribosomal protein S20